MQTQTVIQRLTAILARPVSADDRARARLHLLDWSGCAIAGAREPAGKILLGATDNGAAGTAFAWGGLGNILEMDDVDKRAILHPGPSIIPAALALAEYCNGDALLNSIVRGYEATIRLGRATGAGHYALWHTTGTCGALGAAAACSSLLGLDNGKTAHALALAASQAAGLWQTRHEPTSMGKQLHTANAARVGVDAARLAAQGFMGPLSILEGEQGFFAAMCPGAKAGDVLADYGAGWCIHDVSFKFWPACRHAHAAIDAALEAAGCVEGFGAVERISVRTYADAIKFCDRPDPCSVIEAKFSLQHSVAVVLARGAPSLTDFDLSAINDPEISSLRAKVQLVEDSALTAAYPAHFGSTIQIDENSPVCVPDAWGDPENPIPEEDIVAKAEALLEIGGASPLQIAAVLEAAEAKASDVLNRLQEIVR